MSQHKHHKACSQHFLPGGPVGDTGAGTIIDKDGLILTTYKTGQGNRFGSPFSSLN